MMPSGSERYQKYVSNLNRIYLTRLIETLSRDAQAAKAAASQSTPLLEG